MGSIIFSNGVSILVALVFVFVAARTLSRFIKNNHSPIVSEKAVVVRKYSETISNMIPTAADANGNQNMMPVTEETLYAVFYLDCGEEKVFAIGGDDYMDLVEGETVYVKYQGTRFLGFER